MPTSRCRTTRRTCSRRSRAELRQRRFGDVVRVEVSAVRVVGDGRSRLDAWPRTPTRPRSTDIESPLDLAELTQIVGARPPRPQGRALGPGHRTQAAGAQNDSAARLRRDPQSGHRRPPAVRVVPTRRSRRSRRRSRSRPCDVIAMKTAVYRTSDDSALVGSLIECAEEGKQSVCLVELKARFDERRNIEWSRAMEQAGVHVVHGFADLKIHAKMTLVVRREEGTLPPVRPTRDRQLQRVDRPSLRGHRRLHCRRGHRSRRRRPLQPHHRFRTTAAIPQAARRSVRHARADPRHRDPRSLGRGDRRQGSTYTSG